MRKFIWNQYSVEVNPKGIGTYGTVYFGYDLKNKRKVAIKKIPKIAVADNETFIMRSYGKSKYLPAFYNYFVKNKQAHIVMEQVEGKPLGVSNFYYEGKKRSVKQAVQIVIYILKALQHLYTIKALYTMICCRKM
ncbi:hypothetical protein ACE1TI_09915 [Alteribacillus sp. JSM 102045]|uniref:protein kinase domain-containing protein n=1 Tax=Alteribacillus sp. JSM 102045 TaxID=1562101 RepID=UPI0035C0B82E